MTSQCKKWMNCNLILHLSSLEVGRAGWGYSEVTVGQRN